MNQSAEAFLERLTRHDIRSKDKEQSDGSHLVAIEMAGENGRLYNVVLVFSANSQEVGIRCFQLGHVPPARQRPMLKTLNEINETYAWLRFYLDGDSDIAAALDAIISPKIAANICWELVVRTFSVLDAVQEQIDYILQ